MLLEDSKIRSKTVWTIVVALVTWLGVLYPKVLNFEQASARSIENAKKINNLDDTLTQIRESQIRTETDIKHIKLEIRRDK